MNHNHRSKTFPSAQKLRSSCDNCHTAKVKCASTGSQSCARCLSHNVPCSYSPSLRIAKSNSSKQSNASSSTFARSRQPSTSVDGESVSGQSTPSHARPIHTESVNYAGPAFPDDFGLGNASMQGFDLEQIASNFMPTVPASLSSITAVNSPSEHLAPLLGDQHHSHSSSLSDISYHEGPFFWSTGGMDRYGDKQVSGLSTLQNQLFINEQPTMGEKVPFTAEDAIPEKGEGNARSGDWGLQAGDACDCHVQLLQALGVPPRVIRAAHTNGDTAVANFDVLLAANKRSIGRCATMLGCKECFGGSTSFLLIFTLLSQILALYRSACVSYLVQPVTAPGDDFRKSSIVPGPLRLKFGAYELDQADENLLKKELMLIELRKVESLLSRLKNLVGEIDDRAECSAYEALLAHLTRHLQQIVTIIQPQR
ncbi:MAG: hypothetical protein Q9225_000314 [Loekoesia sp. 1 TL-2023]